MENIEKKSEKLSKEILSIILKHCPFIDDRLYFLDGCKKNKELDIMIDFSNNKTFISFLLGTSSFKSSVDDFIDVDYYVDYSIIKNVIDFIIEDHKSISFIEINNSNVLSLGFKINWTNETIKGIDCNDIRFDINFNDNIELRNYYLFSLFDSYYNYLEMIPSVAKIKQDYLNKIKLSCFNSMDRLQLIDYINQLNEEELRELLFNINTNTFIKYNDFLSKKQSSLKLLLRRSENN